MNWKLRKTADDMREMVEERDEELCTLQRKELEQAATIERLAKKNSELCNAKTELNLEIADLTQRREDEQQGQRAEKRPSASPHPSGVPSSKKRRREGPMSDEEKRERLLIR